MTELKKIIFIVGPTAVGKSEVAACVAKKKSAEIVSCDSMQVYKEIQIANNKASLKIRQNIPHHLIDVVSVAERFDVASFNQLASQAIQEIHDRRHWPLIVGGTGLYMQVLLDGIFEAKEIDLDLREELLQQAQDKGPEVLYNQLKLKDPRAAQKLHPHDLKRVVRALEVFLTEQQPISQLQKKRQGLWGQYDIQIFGLNCDRKKLYQKINERVERMFEEGLVDEIQSLQDLPLSQTASMIIGVKEVRGFLDGIYELEEAKELMKRNTRRLAKRQLTWFRKEKRIRWIDIDETQSPEKTAEVILKEVT